VPTGDLRCQLGDQPVRGPSASAPMRMLMAHVETLATVTNELTTAQQWAARNAMIELIRGVVGGGADGDEPLLMSALAGAARRLAERRLDDRTLAPALVARALNVSPRTLHRAFSVQGEPLMAYVRRRRLERALADLACPQARLTVTEAAARWGFTDSSHLVRACRKRHGQTPTQYVRAYLAAVPQTEKIG
jgi:AraC family transcriptional regulator, positive regulator of tynA and feaB